MKLLKPAVDIEDLLRYLELKGRGSWHHFDTAAKEAIVGLRNSYELADRLAAQGFLEFAWRDRSWEFSPTTLVEGRERAGAVSIQSDRSKFRWHVFGASKWTALSLCDTLSLPPSRSIVEIDLKMNRSKVTFVRHALPIESPEAAFETATLPATASRRSLALMFDALPNIKAAASAFVDESQTIETALLRGASQPEKFDQTTNAWNPRAFDESIGFWRIDSTIRMYFIVSSVRDYATNSSIDVPQSFRLEIVRVPPELGRWFHAFKPGTVSFNSDSQTMDIRLSSAVFDLPMLHERWLTMWGCERRTVDAQVPTISFNHIDVARAAKLASLLSLSGELNARF